MQDQTPEEKEKKEVGEDMQAGSGGGNEAQSPERRHSGRGGLIFGWILVILGILFLLNNFYILDFGRFWPVLIIAIGISLIILFMLRKDLI